MRSRQVDVDGQAVPRPAVPRLIGAQRAPGAQPALAMFHLLYTVCIGIPLCLMLMTAGVVMCMTILGIPIGLTFFALGHQVLKLR
jgi:uncharacterized membrane protein YccF (DUF307 family)